jgi:hypothetical protein
VQGARRLLREGTDSTAIPKAGGKSAIEETCYQCHATLAQSALSNVAQVPNIKDDFSLARHMPIKTADQQTGGGGARHRHRHRHPARQGLLRRSRAAGQGTIRSTATSSAPTATTRTA